jgi:hypothetical protein
MSNGTEMTKEELVSKIGELLEADVDLGFLLALNREDLENLIASIRGRIADSGQ